MFGNLELLFYGKVFTVAIKGSLLNFGRFFLLLVFPTPATKKSAKVIQSP